MKYSIFFIIATTYALKDPPPPYEDMDVFTYTVTLGGMEFYFRNNATNLQSCYDQIKEEYTEVISIFENFIRVSASENTRLEEINRLSIMGEIATTLKGYRIKLSSFIEKGSFDKGASLVDKTRDKVASDFNAYIREMNRFKGFNVEGHNALESLLRGIRNNLVRESSDLCIKLKECINLPRCIEATA